MTAVQSLLKFFTSRRFRKHLRLSGWLAFWLSCVSTLAFSADERDFVVGPLLTGALILTLAHATAWLIRRASQVRAVRGAQHA